MKIRNLAFCGVMASILGVSGAYAAGDATIIASKAYVDARDNLKQNEDKRVTTTLATYNQTSHTDAQKQADYPSMYTLDTAVSNLSTTIGTNALDTNVLADDVDGTKLTKASAITQAKSTTNLATTDASTNVVTIGDGDDTHFPTTKVVADTIKALDSISSTSNTAADNAVSAVSQADGQVSVTTAKLSAAAIADTAKENGNVVDSNNTTRLVTVEGVKASVAKQGSLENGWGDKDYFNNEDQAQLNANQTAATTAGAKNLFGAATANMRYSDNYVPTVKAVEMRVRQAERNATGMKDTAPSATWNDNTKEINIITTADTAGNKTDKLATSNQVQTSVSALKSYVDNADSGKADKGNPTGGASGVFSVVKYNADGAVTAGVKLNTSLENINSASGASNCSNENPCVLTYTGRDYKWTNMDTDGLAGVNNTTQNAAETNVNS